MRGSWRGWVQSSRKRRAGMVIAVTLALASACSGPGGQNGPTTPSAAAPQSLTTVAIGAHANASNDRVTETELVDAHLPAPSPSFERSGPTDVTFPPRTEPLLFRTALEAKYRDGLRRPSGSTFVDQEGTVVWTQEYLRYRVNLCSHADAVIRVFRQIDGFGVPLTCGNPTTAIFPPRNEPLDFMVQLEAKYRDGLRRPPGSSFVDVEGNIVWTQEYLRYRVSTCSHILAQTKVFDQIDGRGVQADCTPPPVAPPAPSPTTPPTGSSSFYSLTVVSSQCGCVIGPVQIRSNGAVVGNLTCPQTASFTIPANAFVSVCDNTGCWFGSGFTMTGSRTIGLACSATARQPQ